MSNWIGNVASGADVWRIVDVTCDRDCEFRDAFMRRRRVNGDGVPGDRVIWITLDAIKGTQRWVLSVLSTTSSYAGVRDEMLK